MLRFGPFLFATLLVPAIAGAADQRYTPQSVTSGHVNVYVGSNSRGTYDSLASQARSLGPRLASYNNRASQPTSSPAIYQARVREGAALRKEVNNYNAAVRAFSGSRGAVPPGRAR